MPLRLADPWRKWLLAAPGWEAPLRISMLSAEERFRWKEKKETALDVFRTDFSHLFSRALLVRARFTCAEAAEREQAGAPAWNDSYLFACSHSVRRLILSAQQQHMNRSCSHNQPWYYSSVAHIMEVSPDHTLNIHGLLLHFTHCNSDCLVSCAGWLQPWLSCSVNLSPGVCLQLTAAVRLESPRWEKQIWLSHIWKRLDLQQQTQDTTCCGLLYLMSAGFFFFMSRLRLQICFADGH